MDKKLQDEIGWLTGKLLDKYSEGRVSIFGVIGGGIGLRFMVTDEESYWADVILDQKQLDEDEDYRPIFVHAMGLLLKEVKLKLENGNREKQHSVALLSTTDYSAFPSWTITEMRVQLDMALTWVKYEKLNEELLPMGIGKVE